MKIIIYSKDYCPYCHHAKNLFDAKGLKYQEINLEGRQAELMALVQKTQMRTVPQIFINDQFIGGYTELKQFDDSRQLDELINTN